MGITSMCGCNNSLNGNNNTGNTIETNLSKIEKYSILKETQNFDLSTISQEEFRTKSGTEWNNLTGLERIINLYKINFIIKKYREHLKRKKNKSFSYNNMYSN